MDRDNNGKFVKGNKAGNGRPKRGKTITDILTAKMDKNEFVNELLEIARDKENPNRWNAIKLIWNYIDGMPLQKQDLNISKEDNPYLEYILNDEDKA